MDGMLFWKNPTSTRGRFTFKEDDGIQITRKFLEGQKPDATTHHAEGLVYPKVYTGIDRNRQEQTGINKNRQ
jgi:hypothetical protein